MNFKVALVLPRAFLVVTLEIRVAFVVCVGTLVFGLFFFVVILRRVVFEGFVEPHFASDFSTFLQQFFALPTKNIISPFVRSRAEGCAMVFICNISFRYNLTSRFVFSVSVVRFMYCCTSVLLELKYQFRNFCRNTFEFSSSGKSWHNSWSVLFSIQFCSFSVRIFFIAFGVRPNVFPNCMLLVSSASFRRANCDVLIRRSPSHVSLIFFRF